MNTHFQTTNEIIPVVPSLNFPCVVNGKRLTAYLTHLEENYVQHIYHVRFSDGYESPFLAIEHDGEVIWIDLKIQGNKKIKTSSSYAKAITPDLNALMGFDLNSECHLIVMDLPTAKAVNVWVIQDLTEPGKYSVYYLNDYHFSLERVEKGWEAYSTRVMNPDKLNEKVVRYITSQIDAKLQ